jgi:hypothetical protein
MKAQLAFVAKELDAWCGGWWAHTRCDVAC